MSEMPPGIQVETVPPPDQPEKRKREIRLSTRDDFSLSSTPSDDRASASIAERVKEVAAPISEAALNADRGSDRPPSENEWGEFGETILGYLSVGYASWLLEGADDFDGDDLELTEEDRRDIVNPWARLIVKTKFNRKHGRKVIQSLEYLDSVITLAVYMHRTRVPLRRKLAKYNVRLPSFTSRRRNVVNNGQVASGSGVPPVSANGATGDVDEPIIPRYNPEGFRPGEQFRAET